MDRLNKLEVAWKDIGSLKTRIGVFKLPFLWGTFQEEPPRSLCLNIFNWKRDQILA